MWSIYEEIEQEWCACYSDARHEPPLRTEFSETFSKPEAENRAKAAGGLQPWLGILEFGIEWLTYVHIALSRTDGIGPQRPSYRVAWALIGSAVSFGLSLRALCLSGFDTPARSLLRSYVETLFLCLATLDDKSLAQAYEHADDDVKVKNFWHEIASPKNLHRRIIQIERKAGLPEDVVDKMTEWRRQEYEVLSQSTHLSYLGSCLTVVPPLLGNRDKHQVGILGRATESSVRTISYAGKTTWYFSRFSFNMLIGHRSSNSLFVMDKENDWHRRIVIGRDVLSRVIAEHWDETAL